MANKETRAVGSYAAVLQGIANPQEEMPDPVNHNPIQHRKRTNINLDTTTMQDNDTYTQITTRATTKQENY
eukprot:8835456-Ditylum_brightwellii.AAC.1